MCSWGKSKNKRATVKYLLFIGLVIPILTGCIIPVPVPLGSEISAQQVSSIKVGDTTRFEIEAMLGEPNVLDEPRFAVYRLSEGRYTVLFIDKTTGISAKESYDLTFVYDSSGVVLREFGYETVIEKDIDAFLSLDDLAEVETVDTISEPWVGVAKFSRSGEWLSFNANGGQVLHQIGNNSVKTNSDTNPSTSSIASRLELPVSACVQLFSDSEQKDKWQNAVNQGNQITISTTRANLSATAEPEMIPIKPLCQLQWPKGVSADGSLFAAGFDKSLSLRSFKQGLLVQAVTDMKITSVSFTPDNKYLISTGNNSKMQHFSSDRDRTGGESEIIIWSLPGLAKIAEFKRKVEPHSIAISEDGKLFAIAATTHIEIWELSIDEYGTGVPYKLKSLIPNPIYSRNHSSGYRFGFIGGFGYYGSLAFSNDGTQLMYVDGLLHIWDVGSGQLLARMAGKEGFLEAMYHDNEQILIAEVTKRSFLGFPKGIKVLKLKLDPILDQYAALYIPSRTTPWATNTNEGSLLSGNFDGSEDETTAMYSLLTGVRILTEEQLLSNIVGNTLARKNSTGGDWAEYYEPPKGDQRKGEIIGKSSKPYSGQWNISGSLMCFDYGGSAGDGCWILSLDEYTVTWYKPNGEKKDESKFPTKLIPGDPEGLGPDTAFSTNITGTYVSDVRGGWAGILGGNRKLKITLEQSGKDIIGTDVNQKKIVAGTRKKDTIKFKYYGRGGQLTGKWKINSDGTKLEGTWNSSREDGKWNLTRIE